MTLNYDHVSPELLAPILEAQERMAGKATE